ncbi:MAG: glycine--tRNA ligase subunit alpha [Micrococcales bacterium]|nr:glycine--tRNA ligase subunit alpha [Micrococcales bacterium]
MTSMSWRTETGPEVFSPALPTGGSWRPRDCEPVERSHPPGRTRSGVGAGLRCQRNRSLAQQLVEVERAGVHGEGAVGGQDEVELSRYAFDVADVEMLRRHFEDWEREAGRCLECAEPLVVPALEASLKMSHLFNLLDARGAVAVTERVAQIGRVRKLAVRCAKECVVQRERLGFPLGRNGRKNGNGGGNGRGGAGIGSSGRRLRGPPGGTEGC